jgi:hypothetical protein
MKNKNVIRKKLENGKFTTIHNSILFDTRLTPNAFRLFTAILSDSDTHFNLSQTLYCKRLGIAKQTFFNAIAKLEECGYLRKTSTGVKDLYSYTLSEYGNLNNENNLQNDSSEVNNSTPETNTDSNVDIKEMPSEYYAMLRPFYKNYNYLMCDDYFNNVFTIDVNNGVDYDVIIEKFEKYLYKKVIASITDPSVNPKSFEEFKLRVKDLIFKLKKYDANFMNTWTVYKLTKNKNQAPRDYETEMGDYYENPRD